MKCTNNLKQLTIAMHNFYDVHNRFPSAGWWEWCNAIPSAKPSYINTQEWGQNGCIRTYNVGGQPGQLVQQRPARGQRSDRATLDLSSSAGRWLAISDSALHRAAVDPELQARHGP